jgi:PAS domain S-box-containing protein
MTSETRDAKQSSESPALQDLIEMVPGLVLCALPDGFAEFANRAWQEYVGCSLQQLTGWGWQTALHPDDVTNFIEDWNASLTAETPFKTEARLRRADGQYHWFSIRHAPAVLRVQSSESLLRILIAFEDINDRKEAQVKLHLSEARQQAFCDNSPNLISLKDPQGRYFYANNEFKRALHVTEEQINGKRDEELFSFEQAAAFQANDRHVLQTGARLKFEDVSFREDGQHALIVQKFPLFDADGEIYAVGCVATDITERQEEESARRYSEERHRLVVETAPDSVISINDQGTIQFANPAAVRMFGYDPSELIGKPLTILMPEFMRDLHENGLKRYLATGQRHINWQGTELTALRKNGQEFPVEVSFGELLRDGHKLFTGFIRDISKRKQADDKLRASERSLRELTETIPQMLWSAEDDGTVNYCNQRTLNYTGLSAEQVGGSGWLTAVHPDDVEKATRAWLGSVASGEAFQCEFRFRRAPDEYRWCISNAIPLRDLDGKVIKWFGTVIDLHDWREAQQALHAIQTRQVAVRADVSLAFGLKESLEAILHQCAESLVRHLDAAFARIWTLSRDGRMLELRASAGLYTHLDGAHSRIPIGQLKIGTIALEQKHVLTNDIINDPRISDNMWAANQGMASFAGYPLLVGTQTLGVMAMFSRKPLATGTPEALASIADLIANGIERKHAEDELRASERILQTTQAELARVSRLTTMGELAASIAHEVNQPLTAVVSNGSACLRLLANNNLEPEVLRQALEGIVADGTRASAVLGRIRALIKKETSKRNELDINEVITEVLVLADRELHANQVLVDSQLKTDLPLVLADRVQLQQVLLNLIMNGIEAMTAVKNRPRLMAVQSGIDESGNVLVAVSDSGTGFGPELDRVFTPFFTTKVNGMGMGLSISRSLIESHGGQLSAAPNSPYGAVFSFTLPAAGGVLHD